MVNTGVESGKTTAAIKMMAADWKGSMQNFLYIAPTKDLADQTGVLLHKEQGISQVSVINGA